MSKQTNTQPQQPEPKKMEPGQVERKGKADTAVKKKPSVPAQINAFRTQLTKYESSVIKLLSENDVTMEKFMVTVENSVRKLPALLNCNRGSLFASILTAAEFGLEPNTPAGLSWIIPYKDNKRGGQLFAEWQIGYQGICNMLYRNPRIKKVMSELVYENDVYDRWMDDEMNWRFKFNPMDDGNRGRRKGVFAIIHLKDAEPLFTYLSVQAIEEIRAKSKKPENYSPTNDPQGWMWKKAAVKQCAKLAPKGGPKTQDALNIDSMIESGATVILDDAGKVILQKVPEKKITNDKLNMVFGDVDEATVVHE